MNAQSIGFLWREKPEDLTIEAIRTCGKVVRRRKMKVSSQASFLYVGQNGGHKTCRSEKFFRPSSSKPPQRGEKNSLSFCTTHLLRQLTSDKRFSRGLAFVCKGKDDGQASESQADSNSPFSSLGKFFRPILNPLGNFGFGKRSIWEGGVGLFLITGGFMFALLVSWIQGLQVRSRSTRYQTVLEFSQACGITVGTPVRIRGVDVGSVVGVKPSLERIDVVAEIMDAAVVIPRNSLVEVNQSGLISETLIDITPQRPIPRPTVGPLSPDCAAEGLIVCDRQHISGVQGVSLDELVGICTKLAKQMDQEGLHNVFQAMDKVSSTVDDARPLLDRVTQITSDLQPLLRDIGEGTLLKNVEALTKVVTGAAADLRELNSSVLTEDNVRLLRDSVSTLTRTLKHVERISNDLSGITGDPVTQSNLKQLIESLSRLVED